MLFITPNTCVPMTLTHWNAMWIKSSPHVKSYVYRLILLTFDRLVKDHRHIKEKTTCIDESHSTRSDSIVEESRHVATQSVSCSPIWPPATNTKTTSVSGTLTRAPATNDTYYYVQKAFICRTCQHVVQYVPQRHINYASTQWHLHTMCTLGSVNICIIHLVTLYAQHSAAVKFIDRSRLSTTGSSRATFIAKTRNLLHHLTDKKENFFL